MTVAYLDSNVVLALRDASPLAKEGLVERLAGRAGWDAIHVISDLVRMECTIRPLRLSDPQLVREVQQFLSSARFVCVGLPPPVFDRAAEIRARYGFRTPDALHLAAALEAGCDVFVTADRRLAAFAEIPAALLETDLLGTTPDL